MGIAETALCVLDFQCVGDNVLPVLPSSYQRKFFAGALFTMFSSWVYFLLVCYSRIPVLLRQCYLISTGVYILFALLNTSSVHYLIMSLLVFAQVRLISARTLPITYLLSTYAYLSCRLIHFMVVDKGETQFHDSGLLMILMARCTFMAFGVYDHMRLKKGHDEEVELTALQLQNELDARPGFMDFFSYVYFSPFLFFGPCTPYKAVNDYIWLSQEEISKRPSFLPFLLQRFSLVIFFSVFFLVFADYAQDEWLVTSHHSIVVKWIWSVFIGELFKMRYYVAILFGECCATASGVGFSGFDQSKRAQFDSVLNMRIFDCIFPCSPKLLMEGWHITISQWLRYSVYERVPVMKTLAVFLASALWHGFYTGILLGIGYGAVLVLASRKMRRLLRHRVNTDSKLVQLTYDVITTAVSVLFSTPFMLIYNANDADKVLPLVKSFLWMPTVICILVALLPIQRPKSKTS